MPSANLGPYVSDQKTLARLDDWLLRVHKADKFNGTVLIAKDGDIRFAKSYGFHSSDAVKPLTKNSSFNLASVSKPFTALAIVLLEHESQLSYEDDLGDWIPELDFYEGVTVRHLLHHTSGLPDYIGLASEDMEEGSIFTVDDLLALFRQQKPELYFTPGDEFDYSNTGYVLLAEIVERVSGQSFEQFMLSSVFGPLEMDDTQVFNLLSSTEPSNRVFGYKNRRALFVKKKIPHDLNVFDGVVGDGAVYSSALDLYRWHNALNDGVLVPVDVYDLAYRSGRLNDGSETGYGFGWVIHSENAVEHTGLWQGFSSYLYRDFVDDELLVVLDNSSSESATGSDESPFDTITFELQNVMDRLDGS